MCFLCRQLHSCITIYYFYVSKKINRKKVVNKKSKFFRIKKALRRAKPTFLSNQPISGPTLLGSPSNSRTGALWSQLPRLCYSYHYNINLFKTSVNRYCPYISPYLCPYLEWRLGLIQSEHFFEKKRKIYIIAVQELHQRKMFCREEVLQILVDLRCAPIPVFLRHQHRCARGLLTLQ